jgi:DNA-binding NarL/FixJ family response regulator
MIRVLLVDDHRLVRTGLASLIEAAPDMTVVGVASDGAEAVEVAAASRPDVVLMDLSMPMMSGIEATRRIVDADTARYVLVLTSFSDRDRVMDALAAGAVGYLLKDSDHEELLRGIRAAAAGDSPLDPRVAREVLRATARIPSVRVGLTQREREVLRLVAEGLANKQIAARLGITERTVKAHLGSAFSRIGVGDRTSAAMWVQRHLLQDQGGVR